MEYVIGVDIGGTFTDCVILDSNGKLSIGKALSTPHDFAVGVVDALENGAANLGLTGVEELLRSTRLFFHACTVADNTLITRTGARTALVVTGGFPDTFLMMRGDVTHGLTEAEASHVAALEKPEPLAPRSLTEEVQGRIDYRGSVLIDVDVQQIEEVAGRLAAKGVESVAVCLLWSIANNAHEKAVADVVHRRHPGIHVSCSSDVAPFLGEYERTATTIFNAYIGPRIASYLRNLQQGLADRGLGSDPLVMQAYGGMLGIEAASQRAIGALESGPAAGVVGSKFIGDLIGEPNVLAADMGGTTFKVSLVRQGVIERDYQPVFERYRILAPKIWVASIGAGGGSIAWIDRASGLLKVGPQGAGAAPGPVAYGVGGTEPTVCDADVALGYLNPDYFLGGRLALKKDAAVAAIEERIAGPLGMTVTEAASGIFRIINAHMSDLIRRCTVERGQDPREFTMVAIGGSAPAHASRCALQLGMRKVVIPLTASVHAATGLISADVTYEYGMSDHVVAPFDPGRLNAGFDTLRTRAAADLATAGFRDGGTEMLRSVDMRYRYQVNEINVPIPGRGPLGDADLEQLYARFDDLYEQSFGQGAGYPEAGREMLSLRVTAIGKLARPAVHRSEAAPGDAREARKGTRAAHFEEHGDFVATDVYDFDRLSPGASLAGPAIIETPVTTIVVNPNDRAEMDEFRNIVIHIGP
ncbi:MAG: hydantoinase/oxoprolinase family protein [Deltaproteobacteria bacterium]|nr:hydantoinase/oxoprolinase family protein [Deltaproteobacteria bacterium]